MLLFVFLTVLFLGIFSPRIVNIFLFLMLLCVIVSGHFVEMNQVLEVSLKGFFS